MTISFPTNKVPPALANGVQLCGGVDAGSSVMVSVPSIPTYAESVVSRHSSKSVNPDLYQRSHPSDFEKSNFHSVNWMPEQPLSAFVSARSLDFCQAYL